MKKQVKKYEHVISRMISLIKTGTLKPGDKAPSVRSTVRQTGLSLMTVLEAYRRLEDMGVLSARQRSGYYVRPEQFWHGDKLKSLPPAIAETGSLSSQTVKVDDKVAALLEEAYKHGVIPLGCGIPDPVFFPSEQLSICMSKVVRSDPLGVNRYSLAPGEIELRRQVSLRLLEAGCSVSEKHITVISGATEGLILALRCLTSPGDTIAIESPGYFGFYRAAAFLGLKAVEIPVDPQTGLIVDEFRKLVRKKHSIRCLVLCSNVSNPTGATMPDESKRRLAEAAKKAGVPIIEDDTYGELYFGDSRPKTLKAFDEENVIQIGGLGKILCPGYRIGWLAGGKYQTEIERLHGMAYLAMGVPNQLAVAKFLAGGGMSRHLRSIRTAYSENIRFFQMAITEHFPNTTRISDPSGGHFLWVQMHDGFDSLKLAQAAIRKNISIAPGVVFSAGKKYAGSFRINCAIPWSEKLGDAVCTLGELVKHQLEA